MFSTKLLKYNSLKKLIAVALGLVLLCLCLLSGCSSDSYSLYFGVNEMPKNIDPQKASLQAELLAVRNCFRGLYKLDTDSDAVPDLAQKTDISLDGLTYTFTLTDAEWKDETKVTSDDFLFAIERASDPVTGSPSVQLLSNIVGVSDRLNGAGDGKIGVSAPDSKTLVIKLIRPDEAFLSKLTQAVFMPCNRKFFDECKGKYGLDRQHILTNGCYYPSQWTENRHLKLTVINKEDEAKPQNVYLTVSSTGKNNIQRIKGDEIGMTVDSVNSAFGINENDYTVTSLYQQNYALVFNKSTEVGANKQLTDAFAKAIHREYYKINMDQRFRVADSVLPKDCILLDKSIGSVNIPKYGFELDSATAREDFLNAIKQLKNKKLPSLSVLCVENEEIKSVLNNIVSNWQSNLGAYVNITTVSNETALYEKVKGGDFTVALVTLSGSATEILSLFADSTSGLYINNAEYDVLANGLVNIDNRTAAVKEIEKCLGILSEESAVIPIISTPTAFVYSSVYQNVHFSIIDGTVNFSIIYKNK